MNDIFDVYLTKRAFKDLKKILSYIALKLQMWIDDIERQGLNEVKKIVGYHDELLKGKRNHQYSIRLSKSYRAIYYIEEQNNKIKFIKILGVNKHDY